MRVVNTGRYFNEYLFHQLINGINTEREVQGEAVILTSRARALHAEFVAKLEAKGKSIDNATRAVFSEVANELLSEHNNGEPVLDSSHKMYSSHLSNFTEMTGTVSKMKVSVAPIMPFDDKVLPLSPYDERFVNRAVFRKNGSGLLFAKEDDIEMFGEEFNSSLSLYKMTDTNNLWGVGPALALDDLSGMTSLMPYMSQKDYESVVDWVNDIGNENDTSRYMSPEAIERSRAILEELQNKGAAYTVSCDDLVGQIKVNVTGTKLAIRLTDEKVNEKFIGRIYDDGYSIYYITNKKDPVTRKALPHENVSAEDCVKLLRFAQGESIGTGEVNTYDRKMREMIRGNYTQVTVPYNTAYHSGKNYSVVTGDHPDDSNSKVLLHVHNSRSQSTSYYRDEDTAIEYIREAVDSARRNFENAVGLDNLIEDAKINMGSDDYSPQFSGDENIASLQQLYWDELVHGDALNSDGVKVDDENQDDKDSTFEEREARVRQHWVETLDTVVGTYEPNKDGLTFNPVSVAMYMTSAYGQYRNNDNLIAAIGKANLNPDGLRGDDFYNNRVKDRLIKFDSATASQMSRNRNPLIQTMFKELKKTISETGCIVKDEDILLDENGIVHYVAERVNVEKARKNGVISDTIEGEIGQIFVPDGKGLVETKFAGSENYLFSPGYEAHIVPQREGENKSVEERTRLKGYEQIMRDAIRYKVRSDLISDGVNVGSTTSVNDVYRRLYETRYPINMLEIAHLEGMSDELLDDIIKTNALRVRYSNEIKRDSTINAEYQANTRTDYNDPANDNYQDYYRLTGGRNMSIMTEDADGYFDKSATSGATNQGIVRYLVESAKVSPDGEIIRGDLDDQTTLMKNEVCKFMDYIPFDRQQMTFSNLLKASCVTKPVRTAQMTFGGWTFDDGYVVSKNFADTYLIRGAEGEMRSLNKGDKISDMNGNKGVISLVVDPNMTEAEAKEMGIEKPWAWFKANEGLDVVGAPFPATSRFNGGSARELMEDVADLHNPDGTILEGCTGTAKYIVTHMPVDEKTHVYGENEAIQGKGRKASAQLAWAFASQDATKVLNACYASNDGSLSNLRELMITMGLDMDELGKLRTEYKPHANEERQLFNFPELEYKTITDRRTKQPVQKVDIVSMKRDFGDVIAHAGGFLEIPFPLNYPTGKPLHEVPAEQRSDSSVTTYSLPIMSAYLRSGQTFADDTSMVHDYTNHYLRIYEMALQYKNSQNEGNVEDMAKFQGQAQAEYNKITKDLEMRKFKGKHNLFRDTIMSNRMSNSATAVWTADPRLNINQVAMSQKMADSLGVDENGHIMLWRDPIIRDTGVRYVEVKIDDTLVGVSINPAMDKSYDGDFDGDSVAVVNIKNKGAIKDAMRKLTVDSNLLDYGSKRPDGKYDLMMQDSLDMKSASYANPELKARREALTLKVNAIESMECPMNLTDKQFVNRQMKARSAVVKELNEYVLDTFENEYGNDVVSFKDMPSHIKSIEHMVINGAKGSYGKLGDYAKYLGVTYDRVDASVDPDQPIDLSTVVDHGKPLTTREDSKATQYAQSVKSFGTGVAGTFSQRGMAELRNVCPKAVLELTYPVTQSVLQSKHDPVEAKRKYEMLMGPARQLWRGVKLDKTDTPNGVQWTAVKDSSGKPIQATPARFKEQFIDFYTHKDGLNVSINVDYVEDVCKGLIDKNTGLMRNIEKGAGRSPMDTLAYGGDFDTLKELAIEEKDLFAGRYNRHFTPNTILTNEKINLEARLDFNDDSSTHKYKAIVKGDTRVKSKSKDKVSSVVTEPVSDIDAQKEIMTESEADTIISKAGKAMRESGNSELDL